MKTSANFFLFFALAFFGLGLSSAFSQTDPKPFQTKEFSVTSAPVLEADLSGAAISVKGGAGNQVTVRCFLKKDGKYLSQSDSEAQEFLEKYDISISQKGNSISIIAKQKSSGNWNWRDRPSLSFEILAPQSLNSDVRTSGGSVSIHGIQGQHQIASSGGSIAVKNSGGSLVSTSSGGSINLENFEGNVEVQTSGGSVKVDRIAGDLVAKSSGGGMTLTGVSGRIDAQTSGGSIRASLNAIQKDMVFQSSGGSIQVSVPSDAKFNLELKGGSISSQLANFQGTTAKNLISGKVNGGGPTVQMQTSGGSIRIGNEN